MSRVEEGRRSEELQRQQQVENDKRKTDEKGGERFREMMQAKQAPPKRTDAQKQTQAQTSLANRSLPKDPKQTQKGDTRSEAAKQAATTRSSESVAQNALLARQGISSQKFDSLLKVQSRDTASTSELRRTDRDEQMSSTREASDSDSAKATNRRLGREERVAAIQREERQDPNASGMGLGRQDTTLEPEKEGAERGVQSVGSAGKAEGPAAARGPQAAHEVKQIPPEMLEKLVENVRMGVDANGLGHFSIEFKDQSVLKGVSLDVTAGQDGISLRFTTGDANVKRLLQSSEGELLRAFEGKGLRLKALDIIDR